MQCPTLVCDETYRAGLVGHDERAYKFKLRKLQQTQDELPDTFVRKLSVEPKFYSTRLHYSSESITKRVVIILNARLRGIAVFCRARKEHNTNFIRQHFEKVAILLEQIGDRIEAIYYHGVKIMLVADISECRPASGVGGYRNQY